MNVPAVEIKDLAFAYGRGAMVLDGVDLTVGQGDYMAVLGPNGGGKTTLLKIMLGLLKPVRGTVRILGGAPGAGAQVGYVPQSGTQRSIFPIRVMEAVLMGRVGLARPGLGYGPDDREKAALALERVGAADLAARTMDRLSGGQRQRVLIARALAGEPRLLLLDEPLANVDMGGRCDFYQLLSELNKDMTVICVSHDLNVVARGVRSVACVNRTLHFHDAPTIDMDMLRMMYGGQGRTRCPVELIAHGEVPHRVLAAHPGDTCPHGHTGHLGLGPGPNPPGTDGDEK